MFIQLTSAEEANSDMLIRVQDIIAANSITLGSVVKVSDRNGAVSKSLVVKESLNEIHKRIKDSLNS